MEAVLQHIADTLRGMWHRRWIGLAVAWIAAIVAVTIAWRIPERYEASARVYVDTQSLLRPLMEGLSIQPNLNQQVALMSRTLISRPNVEKVVRMADLDLDASSPDAREERIDGLMKSVQLSGNVNTNLYVISYRHSNPELARKVVQSFLTIFVESSLGDKRQDAKTAVKFVDDQIKQYEENLRAAEDRLKAFRLKYLGVAGSSGPDYFARLSKLSEDLEAAKQELRAAEQARDAYKRELAGESPVFLPDTSPRPVAPPSAASALDPRIAALRTELDSLSRRYTESHPDIIAIKRNLAQLEAERKAELDARAKAAAAEPAAARPEGVAVERNPVYQQLRVSLAEAEANVARLRARLGAVESQYAQLKAAARLVPQVESEHAQLNRDYEVQKKVYETLLARRESATIGEGVQDAGGTQFRVIDPPRVSPNPIPPTRVTMLALAIAAAIGAGLIATFATSEIMPTFHDARSLRQVTHRPVLGMVTMLPSPALSRVRRRNAYLFAGGLASLVMSLMAVMALALATSRWA